MPLSIEIPGSGPGTGPYLLPALYSLGVDDYTHRYDAERLGATGSLVTSWPDAGPNAIAMANPAATVFSVATESGVKYLHKAVGATGALTAANAIPTTGPYTIAAILRVDPTNLNASSRNALSFNGMTFQRSSNGAYGMSGPGGSSNAGSNTSLWAFAAFCVGPYSTTFDDGDFTFQLNASRNTALANSSQVITPTTSGSLAVSVSLAAIDADYNTVVTWNRKLSNAELDTVRNAMIANSPLI